jgi:hypothetical protein
MERLMTRMSQPSSILTEIVPLVVAICIVQLFRVSIFAT